MIRFLQISPFLAFISRRKRRKEKPNIWFRLYDCGKFWADLFQLCFFLSLFIIYVLFLPLLLWMCQTN